MVDLPDDLMAESRILSGWGRTKLVSTQVVKPKTVDQMQRLIRKAEPQSLITRGLGRSYGDAAYLSDGVVVELSTFKKVTLDHEAGVLTAGAGATFDQILSEIIPAGFFLPVTPGTRNVTVGGAIAADVHGKNHHIDGSFGNHVCYLLLLDGGGEIHELTPNGNGSPDNSEMFWATVGGMGLTGVILEAKFKLIPITTSLVRVDTTRFNNLDSLMAAMVDADSKYRYSVAWVDSLDPNGRGILTCGDHAQVKQLSVSKQVDPLLYDPKAIAATPHFLRIRLLNQWTVRAFNEAWFHRAPKQREGELQTFAQFFHPLDAVKDWNLIYGPAGFLQYQFAVPNEAAYLVPRTLEKFREIGAPSFLTVLKRFGPSNRAPLSFPMPGWTLAIDVPASIPGLMELLDHLDEEVQLVGGRIYLAKDSRMKSAVFRKSYLDWNRYIMTRDKLDTRAIFSSEMSLRLFNYN